MTPRQYCSPPCLENWVLSHAHEFLRCHHQFDSYKSFRSRESKERLMDSAALLTYGEQHLVPQGTCNGSTQGPMNPDGKCILGGILMGAGLRGDSIPSVGYPSVGCMAYPVFAQEMVPYTDGVISGDNYQRLATLKIGTKLLGQP